MRSLTPLAVVLLLVAASLPVSIAATNIALALLTAVLLTRSGNGGTARALETWRRTPAVWGILLYCLTGLAATIFGIDPARSLHDNAKDFHKLWVLLILISAFSEESPRAVWTALACGFATIAAIGLGQTAISALRHQPGFPFPRPHAFVHPVVYGEQLALCLLGGLCALLRPAEILSKVPARRLGAALMALTTAILVFNQTRSTVFALAGGCAVIFSLEPTSRKRVVWMGVTLLCVAATWEFLPTGDRRSLFRLLVDFNPRDSQNARYVLWSVALGMFRDHPLTGVGPGHYGTLFTQYFQGALDNESVWSSAHNLFFHQLAERGLIGAAGLIAALGTLAFGAWRGARLGTGARSLWAASALAAFLVMNLTEVAFQNEQVTTLVLFLWAWGTTPLRARGENL